MFGHLECRQAASWLFLCYQIQAALGHPAPLAGGMSAGSPHFLEQVVFYNQDLDYWVSSSVLVAIPSSLQLKIRISLLVPPPNRGLFDIVVVWSLHSNHYA